MIFALIIHTEFCSALWNYVHNVVFSNYVQQMGWSLARRNSRAVLGRVHFPTLPIIYSNYNQCLCAVQIKHGDNKRGRGALEGDKMHPRGDEESDLECKSAKAKRLLREVTHSSIIQPVKTELYKIALTSILFNQTDYHLHACPIRK